MTAAVTKCRFYTRKDLGRIPELERLPRDRRLAMRAVSAVLPFRVNQYVVEELIDWDRVPDDPMYQLTFPQESMLDSDDLRRMMDLCSREAHEADVTAAARAIQRSLNPHPAGQLALNVPRLDGEPLAGVQHKYRETVLFFPAQGQTCHAYCTYCFRWAQFVGIEELKFAERQADRLVEYLRKHPYVQNVLFTGGDPMVMKTRALRRYIEPLLAAGLDQLESIRIGTKAPAYWPHRFLGDSDADDLLRLFEEVVDAGVHLAVMAHYSHPRELETEAARAAIRRIRATGAVVRSQAPLIRHVNDSAAIWRDMWRTQVRLGVVPYYMFVERDTGPKNYFEVPLARALSIFNDAYRAVSGLGRTVRGPSMSATPGKVLVDGVTEIGGEKHFVLKMLQAREPRWVGETFLARFDPAATWLDDLEPAFGESSFFFEAKERFDIEPRRRSGRRVALPLAAARGGEEVN
jgi:KamA family protein